MNVNQKAMHSCRCEIYSPPQEQGSHRGSSLDLKKLYTQNIDNLSGGGFKLTPVKRNLNSCLDVQNYYLSIRLRIFELKGSY